MTVVGFDTDNGKIIERTFTDMEVVLLAKSHDPKIARIGSRLTNWMYRHNRELKDAEVEEGYEED